MNGSLSVIPDPKRLGGGFARLLFPAGSVPADTVSITVFNLFRERYLGPADWQPTATHFGPYAVETRPDGGQSVTIGPEIVNSLEEFVTLRFQIGSYSSVVTWPDTVPQVPGAPGIGEVLNAEQVERIEAGTLRGTIGTIAPPSPSKTPEPPRTPEAPEPPELPETPEPETSGDEPPPPPPPDDPKKPWWLLVLLLAVILAGAGGWYYFQSREEPVPPQESDTVVTPTAPAQPTAVDEPPPPECSAEDALARTPSPREALESLLEDAEAGRCAGSIDAEFGLSLLRSAAASGSSDALMAFGDLYNGMVSDPVLEERLGMVLSDDPTLALDYYAQAREAGADGAADAIASVCDSIAEATDPLVANARREFCE